MHKTFFHLLLILAFVTSAKSRAGMLLSLDFDSSLPAPLKFDTNAVPPSLSRTQSIFHSGTIDSYMGIPSQALVLTAHLASVDEKVAASVGVSTGPIPVRNAERDLAKLTVSFDLQANLLRPVRLIVSSYREDGQKTGSRFAIVVPPVAGAYYRFGIDLDKTLPLEGSFDPLAPFVDFSFSWSDSDGTTPMSRVNSQTLQIDNLGYSNPSYYVSPTGSDSADGRTPETAFATPQHAADTARAGDVVLLRAGTYGNISLPDFSDVPDELVNSNLWRPWWVEKSGSVVTFRNSGSHAAWIVFRNFPGETPVLLNLTGWNAAKIGLTAAYVELRGLTLRGNRSLNKLDDALADGARNEENGRLYHGAARYNANGIVADGRPGKSPDQRPHHLRFIDNILCDNSGAGASIMGAEYVTFEGNESSENCHFMRYGASGLGTLLPWNWDANTNHKIFYLRNVCHGNRTDVPCGIVELDAQGNPLPRKLTDRYSDGNGIIVDVNQNNQKSLHVAYEPYIGRTLVQNNLVYDNGGSGIHTVSADHVDIVSNTAWQNSASPHLNCSQIYSYASNDVRIAHNILVAPVADLTAGEKPEPVNKNGGKNIDVVYSRNLYFGGNIPPELGEGDRVGDPLFLHASRDPEKADFHLRANSPSPSPENEPFLLPYDDLDRKWRSLPSSPGALDGE